MIFVVSGDYNSTIGALWIVVAVSFDPWEGHGWNGVGCVVFASEAAILLSVYHCVDGVIMKALFLLLISL